MPRIQKMGTMNVQAPSMDLKEQEKASNTEDGGNEGDFHGSQGTDMVRVDSDGIALRSRYLSTALHSASPRVPCPWPTLMV